MFIARWKLVTLTSAFALSLRLMADPSSAWCHVTGGEPGAEGRSQRCEIGFFQRSTIRNGHLPIVDIFTIKKGWFKPSNKWWFNHPKIGLYQQTWWFNHQIWSFDHQNSDLTNYNGCVMGGDSWYFMQWAVLSVNNRNIQITITNLVSNAITIRNSTDFFMINLPPISDFSTRMIGFVSIGWWLTAFTQKLLDLLPQKAIIHSPGSREIPMKLLVFTECHKAW